MKASSPGAGDAFGTWVGLSGDGRVLGALSIAERTAQTGIDVPTNDDGEPIGAILADLDASVNFGGKMMMIPPSTFAEQIEENEAGEAVIEACSEVFNNLTSAINRVPGNKHVRSRPAELTKSLVGSEPWLSESKGGSYGGSDGCIYIYYRG